ncbi:MAG TPA: TolC family protein, partial [Burkholderiaceae bacterium]|nr:TolC family protein [Burkholderiaceae bacterium]
MTSAPQRPTHSVWPAALAIACALALLPAWARAQSLRELYDAARAYDATYLAARAQADSAQYRAAQAEALNRPNVGLSANANRTDVDVPPTVTGPDRRPIPLTSGHFFNNRVDATVNAIQPLYNRNNDATITQAQRALDVALTDLESAEQDLIIRVAQAYFDVL